MYNIIHKENEKLHTQNGVQHNTNNTDSTEYLLIQTALNTEYQDLFSVQKFFYAILHFLEEYVIFPILGEKDEVQLSVRDTELKTSNTMGEVSNDRNDGIE